MSVTRLPKGLANSPPGWAFGDVPYPVTPSWYQYFNDFSTYAAGDWTVTTGGGTTALVASGLGGKIIQTTAASDDDLQANQLAAKSFAFASGQDVAFFINFQLSAVAGSTGPDFLAGLADTFADITPTDGVYFNKAQGSTTLNLLITNTGTSTTIPVGTLAAATAYTVGFFYSGSAAVPELIVYSTIPYAAGTVTQPSPYWPGGNLTPALASNASGATYSLANLPATSTLLTMGFGVQAGSSTARTCTVDYVYAGQSISRY